MVFKAKLELTWALTKKNKLGNKFASKFAFVHFCGNQLVKLAKG